MGTSCLGYERDSKKDLEARPLLLPNDDGSELFPLPKPRTSLVTPQGTVSVGSFVLLENKVHKVCQIWPSCILVESTLQRKDFYADLEWFLCECKLVHCEGLRV